MLAAFNYDDLEMLVRHHLDVWLEHIIGPRHDLKVVVFHLIKWAELRGKVEDLLRGALAERLASPLLREIAKALLPSEPPPAPPPPLPGPVLLPPKAAAKARPSPEVREVLSALECPDYEWRTVAASPQTRV